MKFRIAVTDEMTIPRIGWLTVEAASREEAVRLVGEMIEEGGPARLDEVEERSVECALFTPWRLPVDDDFIDNPVRQVEEN